MSRMHDFFLFADAVMVGIIWAVQLIVYPGFSYFSRERLLRWHDSYSRRVTILVAPLMLTQLGFGVFWAFSEPGIASLGYVGVAGLLWAITFMAFVPIHRRIGQGTATPHVLARLVSLNAIRTFLWTLLLLWHLYFSCFPLA
ncbi:hypothetical protein [Robiginitalea marina]|uniref:DUF4149 domain-containing protein n=1 Tax=Robiginitalea marina TaxID=2954105 RepID=A0ABT1B039_9FLAO|nr:hypothetical protein [Robiginitalea marina]MCO5724783.1 hypothetical protein [Robiginitalea marina]